MKLFEQASRFVWRGIFIVAMVGVVVIGWVLPGMSQAAGLALMGAWSGVVLSSYGLWRRRASQQA